MKKVVILSGLTIFVLLSAVGVILFLHSDELFPSPSLQEDKYVPSAPDTLIEPPVNVSSHGDPITEPLTTKTVLLSPRAKVIIAVVGVVILLAWMAALGFLIYRRYQALLAETIAKDNGAPSAWTVISDIFYPRVSTTTILTYTDEQGIEHTVLQPAAQTPEGLTERYGLLALSIGFIFGVISFTSTLASSKSLETAAITGAKSAILSAIGQATVLFIISYL